MSKNSTNKLGMLAASLAQSSEPCLCGTSATNAQPSFKSPPMPSDKHWLSRRQNYLGTDISGS
jgi:hypothetical protein